MEPGELFLYSAGGASLHLKNDGSIAVTGNVSVEGSLEVKGNVRLTGIVEVVGGLLINGKVCPACGL